MSTRKRSGKGEDFKPEDVLQAVVIADSFNIRFAPITHDKPRALLPLVNVPLIDYTLEFLAAAGIEEVIIFCCVHASQIKKHIENSKWASNASPIEIITIVSESCLSVGDALREIDSRSLVQTDFILVNGDLISNAQLKSIIETHRARRLKEKTPIMTLVYKNAPPGHQTRCKEDDVLLAIDPSKSRILHYQKGGGVKKFEIPLELFQQNPDVELHYDLLDCHISVCSPTVPPLFTDNFDYLTKDDFIRGVLVNEEILGNTIHVHILEDEYAARVSNLQMYDSISKDVINRWSYPMVPDQPISGTSCTCYSYGRHNIYLNKDVTLARDCVLEENVVIGKGTSIGTNTSISQSVIGENCKIGENVVIKGAYIWDGVTIEDRCTVSTSVVANGVHLKENVHIKPGSVLAAKVVVGPNVSLDQGTMLMAKIPQDEFGEEQTTRNAEIDTSLVGREGKAYCYQPAEDEEELEELILDVWGLEIQTEDEEESSASEEDSDLEEGKRPESPVPEDDKMFYKEVFGTLERALEENIGTENMVLEINSLKHAYNIQIHEVNHLVTKAILELPHKNSAELEAPAYLTEAKKLLSKKKLLPLLQNYIRSRESQMNCLSSMEELVVNESLTAVVLMKLIHHLYDLELLEEESILKWHEDVPIDQKAVRRNIRKKVAPLIQWLEEAEEESDE